MDQVSPASLQDEVKDIEKELLLEIARRLDEQKMSAEEAQQLAKDFLALLPFQDQKDLLSKLKKLSDENVEAAGVYYKYATPIHEMDKQKRLELISQHISTGKIEDAIEVAKGGTANG